MRFVAAALMALCLWNTANSQTLTEVCRSGTIALQPDTLYAGGVDWDAIFADYFAKKYGNAIGTYRSLVVADDGSAFVGNYSSYSVYKFNPDGEFLMEFGESGSKPGQFSSRPTLQGVLDDELVFTTGGNGRITFFDLQGKFRELVQVDYMPLSCVGLREGKYAVAGHVPHGGGDVRYIVAIRDLATGNERIVSSFLLKEEDRRTVTLETENGQMIIGNPHSRVDVFIERTTEGNLVLGYSNSPEISVFSPEGKRLISFTLDIVPIEITDEVRDDYYDGLEEVLAERGSSKEALDLIDQSEFFPDHMPYYYYMLTDSENNLLVFPYTDDDALYRFQVYSLQAEGAYVCEADIELEALALTLNNRFRNMRFHNSKLYGILALKEDSGIPLRLVKMSLSSEPY
jgi:hypothetical protein